MFGDQTTLGLKGVQLGLITRVIKNEKTISLQRNARKSNTVFGSLKGCGSHRILSRYKAPIEEKTGNALAHYGISWRYMPHCEMK